MYQELATCCLRSGGAIDLRHAPPGLSVLGSVFVRNMANLTALTPSAK